MKTLLVIFGITGDLSTRKLLPALSCIIDNNQEPGLTVLGISRHEFDAKDLAMKATNDPLLADITDSLTMDVSIVEEYKKISEAIKKSNPDQVLMYLAVPPGAAAQIVDMLGEAGLNTPNIHLLFEKPFGFDLDSAKDFIERTGRYFKENQLYRIDHYAAKEVAVELIKLRRNAKSKSYSWGAESVENITIVASESIGIEGRVQFYEQTGALRDFIQGHLMQLLALVLMSRPSIDEKLPLQRLKALRLVELADPAKAIRGQYRGYQGEVANPGSTVETYVNLELQSNDPNWKGVPIRLVTGKSLYEKHSYVEVEYKDGWSDVYEEGKIDTPHGARHIDAYERVLLEAIAGREELFTSSEEVLRSWEILAPVQYAWGMDSDPVKLYEPGSHFTTVFSR